jgi:hypothetical protein
MLMSLLAMVSVVTDKGRYPKVPIEGSYGNFWEKGLYLSPLTPKGAPPPPGHDTRRAGWDKAGGMG